MLAHRPPLPLIIDYIGDHDITAREKEGILVALRKRDRVRRIRLQIPVLDLETLVVALDEEFPMLEYLAIAPPVTYGTSLMLPKTFQAPHLRHLMISNTAFFRGSPLFTTAACLVTPSLVWVDPSTYLYPGDLLQHLSCVPQLEKLQISFDCPLPPKTLRRMLHMPIMTHATFPNLRRLGNAPSFRDRPFARETQNHVLLPTHLGRSTPTAIFEHDREPQICRCQAHVL